MTTRLLNLTFPAGGIARSVAYQSQPPYTCQSARNVRTLDTYERRARGGSRPGLTTALPEEKHADMQGPIRWLGSVPWVSAAAVRLECLVAIEGADLYYSNNGTSLKDIAGSGKIAAAVAAGTGELYATVKQQKLYIANPGGTGDARLRVFDPATATVASIVISAGFLPPPSGNNCPLICTYRDRIVLAGPNQGWYMSRLCTPGDWAYFCDTDDPARPFLGGAGDVGSIGEPITATVPFSRDLLIFGCVNSISVLQGDPAMGGRVVSASYDVGFLSGSAWCRTPEGLILFLSRDGLYSMSPGASLAPQPVSRSRLPDALLNLDPVANRIGLAFNFIERGVHISVTPATGVGQHWFMHYPEGAFWEDELPADAQPTAYCQFALDQTAPKTLLLGGREGFIFKYDRAVAVDHNGNDPAGGTRLIGSDVLLGPIKLGGDEHFQGLVSSLTGILDGTSGAVTWGLQVGDSPEAAATAAPLLTGTWSGGRNYIEHPRLAGCTAYLKLSSTSRWAMEAALLRIQRLGVQRGPA